MEPKQFFKKSRKFYLLVLLLLIFTVPVGLSGCGGGGGGGSSSSSPSSATYTVAPTGGSAITRATVTMYDLTNSASTTCQPTSTSGQYSCTFSSAPSSTDALYITVSGGSAGSNVVLTNLVTPTIINNKGYNNIPVNELTTVAATDVLKQAGFTKVSTGKAPTPPTTNATTAIKNAVLNITNIADSVHLSTANGTGQVISTASTSQNSEQIESLINVLDTLANALSTCVNNPSSCSTLLQEGGVSSNDKGTTLNVVVNVYNNNSSSGSNTTLSLSGLTTIASSTSSEFSSGTSGTNGTTTSSAIEPLYSIPITSTSPTTSSTPSISSAVMYQYVANNSSSSSNVIDEFPINPSTGVVNVAATQQSVTTGQGVSALVFNENNTYAYGLDDNGNIWVYSVNNGLLSKDTEYSFSQYYSNSANYSNTSNENPFLYTNTNTLYIYLPNTSNDGSTLIAIPINSDGSLDFSGEVDVNNYQGNNFYGSISSDGNVIFEVYDSTNSAYAFDLYSVNSSGMISTKPLAETDFLTAPYAEGAENGYFLENNNNGYLTFISHYYNSNTGPSSISSYYDNIYNISISNNTLTVSNPVDTNSDNLILGPNGNHLYYLDGSGDIYSCNISQTTPSCSEAVQSSSYVPSGNTEGNYYMYSIADTLYVNAQFSSYSSTSTGSYTYINYLFPFTDTKGTLTFDKSDILSNTENDTTSYGYFSSFNNSVIYDSQTYVPGTTTNSLEIYPVNASGLITSTTPITLSPSFNGSWSYVGDGSYNNSYNLMTYNNSTSGLTINYYTYSANNTTSPFNNVGSITLSNINSTNNNGFASNSITFPFGSANPLAIYLTAGSSSNSVINIYLYGISIGSSGLTLMNNNQPIMTTSYNIPTTTTTTSGTYTTSSANNFYTNNGSNIAGEGFQIVEFFNNTSSSTPNHESEGTYGSIF